MEMLETEALGFVPIIFKGNHRNIDDRVYKIAIGISEAEQAISQHVVLPESFTMIRPVCLQYLHITHIYCHCHIIAIDSLEIVDIVFLIVPIISDIEPAASLTGNDVMEVSVGDNDYHVAPFARDEYVPE